MSAPPTAPPRPPPPPSEPPSFSQLRQILEDAAGSKSRHTVQRRLFHALQQALQELASALEAEVQQKLSQYEQVLGRLLNLSSSAVVVSALCAVYVRRRRESLCYRTMACCVRVQSACACVCESALLYVREHTPQTTHRIYNICLTQTTHDFTRYVTLYRKAKAYQIQSKLSTWLELLSNKSTTPAQRVVLCSTVGAFFNAMPKACQSYLNDMSALMVKQLKSNDQALRAAAMNSLAHIMNTAAKPAQSCHLDVVKGMAKVAVGDRSEEVRRAGAAVILVVGAHSAETGFTSVGLEALVQVCTKGEDGGRKCNREGTGQIGRATRMAGAGPSMAYSRGVHCNQHSVPLCAAHTYTLHTPPTTLCHTDHFLSLFQHSSLFTLPSPLSPPACSPFFRPGRRNRRMPNRLCHDAGQVDCDGRANPRARGGKRGVVGQPREFGSVRAKEGRPPHIRPLKRPALLWYPAFNDH